MSKKKNFLSAAIITGLSVAAGTVAYKVRKDRRTFTRDKWDGDISKRYNMADNLIRTEKLIGMTRKEVVDFLGINGLRCNEKDSMEYYLSLNTDEPKLLIIEFDDEEKVINCTACV